MDVGQDSSETVGRDRNNQINAYLVQVGRLDPYLDLFLWLGTMQQQSHTALCAFCVAFLSFSSVKTSKPITS